jgi:hypothetical protein
MKLDLPANFTVFFCFQKGKKFAAAFFLLFRRETSGEARPHDEEKKSRSSCFTDGSFNAARIVVKKAERKYPC